MEYVWQFIDTFLHLDKHIALAFQQYGAWLYAILFLIVFCETGLVVTPILPGDSLLFATGALTVSGGIDPFLVMGLLIVAAILGDAVNYGIGHWIGDRANQWEDGRFFRKKYLEQTHSFYERYGAKTIVIARFVPIVRTFAPFVAGIARMTYAKFGTYNVVGAVLWVVTCVVAGRVFGQLPFVKENFSLVILGICAVSVMPMVVEMLRERQSRPADPM